MIGKGPALKPAYLRHMENMKKRQRPLKRCVVRIAQLASHYMAMKAREAKQNKKL